jgi:hypothetical protein
MMGPPDKASEFQPFQISLRWLLAYVTAMALVAGGLAYGRTQLLATYGTAEAKTEWEAWRAEAQKMAQGAGPVKRRVPGSLEPPALVLMRDHFAVCLGFALLLSTVLFGTFMYFVRGAMATKWSGGPHRT